MSSDLDLSPADIVPWGDDAWRVTASRAVHPSQQRPDQALLMSIAEGVGSSVVPGPLSVEAAPDGRSYQLLLETAEYEAWIIQWPPGTGLPTHDHGASVGALFVVEGALDEDVPCVDGTVATRHLTAGQVVPFDVGYVHAVTNRSTTTATSVHVYAPPLSTVGFYRTDGGDLVLERVEG